MPLHRWRSCSGDPGWSPSPSKAIWPRRRRGRCVTRRGPRSRRPPLAELPDRAVEQPCSSVLLGLLPVVRPALRLLEVFVGRRPLIGDGILVVPLEAVAASAPFNTAGNAFKIRRGTELEGGA